MATFETFKLVQGDVMYLTGETLNALAAKDGCFELLDTKGRFVLDEQFYKITSDGIERVD